MQETFEFDAEIRQDVGKGASRRLRNANGVPAIIYGGDSDPVNITLKHNELVQHLDHEAFYSHVLTLKLDGKPEKVVLRDLQRHPYKPFVMHADFLRVDNKTELRTQVPIHFVNEDTCAGIKAGGVITHIMTEVEIKCLAKDLPEYLEIDMADMDIGDSVHLSDIKLPAGVEILALSQGDEHDQAIVNIQMVRAQVETTEEPEAPSEVAGEGESEEGGEGE